jgi:predicted nucleic acid-binding protein
MTLVDTSVWVAHFKGAARARPLQGLLAGEQVLVHPHVLGELVLGGLPPKTRSLMSALPLAPTGDEAEVLALVDAHALCGSGIGWVDAHLLASALLARGRLWTMDEALAKVARTLGLGSGEAHAG